MSKYRNIGPEDGWSRSVYVDEYGNTEAYCELTGKVILGEDTCDKWVEGE